CLKFGKNLPRGQVPGKQSTFFNKRIHEKATMLMILEILFYPPSQKPI
ncbi:MAG: hypothetical protein ACI8VT_003350, partial [Saprospiraceae bacterium]